MNTPFHLTARWIWSHEGVDTQPAHRHDNYRVRFFRRTFTPGSDAGRLVVHITADSRYVLWVNGTFVDRGPGRGDIAHHFYDTHDVSRLLRPGRQNVLAVMVIYVGDVMATFDTTGAPCNLMTAAPGLAVDAALIDADGNATQTLHSDPAWKVLADPGAYRHEHCDGAGTFVGFTERFAGEHYPWGWQQPDFDDRNWPDAWAFRVAATFDTCRDNSMPQRLVPRMIPSMEQRPQRFDRVVEAFAGDAAPGTSGDGGRPLRDLVGKPIGRILQLLGKAGQRQVDEASAAQWKRRVPLGDLLVEKGVVTRADVDAALAVQSGIARLDQDRCSHAAMDWQSLIERDTPLVVPANSTQRIIIQMDRLTTCCPHVQWTGGAGSVIRLTYAEAPLKDGKKVRGPEPRGQIFGTYDELFPGGGDEAWEAWHYRTYRFVRIDVCTAERPLTIRKLDGVFFAYPYELKASFESSDPFHAKLFDVGYWTTRMCSHEVIEDCPYYEQLPYAGDVCVESDLAAYLTGDQRLVRQTLTLFDWSRNAEGLTMSRYPSRCPQIIPGWSQFWIQAVFNQYQYDGDASMVRPHLPTIATVLDWFERKREVDGHGAPGVVGKLNWWSVMDWSPDWGIIGDDHTERAFGVPPGTYMEASAIWSFFHVWCLRAAAELFDVCGQRARADEYATNAQALAALAHDRFWDAGKGVYRDRLGGPEVSQLTNAFAILSDTAPREMWTALAPALADDSHCRAAYFGLHFVFHALHKAGRFDLFYPRLDTWRKMVETEAMTTIAEDPVHQRSDCHAWSAGPVYHLLAHSLGVRAHRPGFAELLIAPQPGPLAWLKGAVATPRGLVGVALEKKADRWTLRADVPAGLPTVVRLPGQREHAFAQGGPIEV